MDILSKLLFSAMGALAILYGLRGIVPEFKEQTRSKSIVLTVVLTVFLVFFDVSILKNVLILCALLIYFLKWVFGRSSFIASLSVLFLYLILILTSMITSNLGILMLSKVIDFRAAFVTDQFNVVVIFWMMYIVLLRYYQLIMKIFKKINNFNSRIERLLVVSNVLVFSFIVAYQKMTFVNLVKINSTGLIDAASSSSVPVYMNSTYVLTTMLTFSVVILINRLCIVDNNMENYKYKAETDLMTGVLSREAGLTYLKEEMMNSVVKGQDLTVAYIDINDLKVVNDKFGHKEGDRLIKVLSGIIQDNLREFDVIARLGGDEFMVIFRKCNVLQARKVWYRITDEFLKLNTTGEYNFKISASAGFTEYHPSKHQSVIQLIHEADEAMYLQKKSIKAARL
ncbi:MAG: GGDEF domain-containing protein [Clostridia bacterium]|nr:GGDEF domain-containing protein [Clostridia bacterium]